MAGILVVGYGNELRGDDGVGPAVARRVEELCLVGVQTMALHQLAPELAEAIAAVRAVIFVDARPISSSGTVEVIALEPDVECGIRTHTSNPRSLLALANALFGRSPPAWLVAVPGTCFDLVEGLSPLARAGVAGAVEEIRRLWTSLLPVSEAT